MGKYVKKHNVVSSTRSKQSFTTRFYNAQVVCNSKRTSNKHLPKLVKINVCIFLEVCRWARVTRSMRIFIPLDLITSTTFSLLSISLERNRTSLSRSLRSIVLVLIIIFMPCFLTQSSRKLKQKVPFLKQTKINLVKYSAI